MKTRQTISFSSDLLEQARNQAKVERRSLSNIIDRALYEYLNQSPTIQRHERNPQQGGTPSNRPRNHRTTRSNGAVK